MSTATGVTADVLDVLGLDPDVDGPLVEWHDLDDLGAWVADADRSHGLVSYSTQYGRADARGKVPPIQITVRASRLAAGDAPDIGDRFRIALCAAAAAALGLDDDQAARFTGEVTDVTLDPVTDTWTVIGVGTLARKARTAVDLTLAGAQLATDRVVAILAAIDAGDDIGLVDDSTVQLAALDAPAAASALLDGITDTTLGLTVQELDGHVDWLTPDHRRGASSAVTFTTSEILRAITWSKHIGSTINVVTVNYTGGSVIITDHASVRDRGPYPLTVTTTLTDAGDARGLGVLLVGRFATPAWDLPAMPLDIARTVDPDKLAALFKLRHGDRITLADLPAGGGVVGDFDPFVEGFTEQADRWKWRLSLAVTDPALSGVAIRWMDTEAPAGTPVVADSGDASTTGPYAFVIDEGDASSVPDIAGLAWENVHHALRWIDLARIEDASELGTFNLTYDEGTAA